ncbi:Thiamine kinase [Metakosakonia massiliensis]|uniref:Thiamine kinase n=2 Tax=Phytobacter massiliensis TaxID=1485952 RepID=A0A6N3GEF6_9ENTR
MDAGLSGGSCLISDGRHRLVLRQAHSTASSPFLRQYRALKRLPPSLAPQPKWLIDGWMAIEYIQGEIPQVLPPADDLAALLCALHRHAPLGWRITLLPLLARYWQESDPSRRTPLWLKTWKTLRQRGEPPPLRLAPLHMDVHTGNLVHSPDGLRLIDWEYAGDGDIALELASVWMDNTQQRRALVDAYAQRAAIAPRQLWRQVQRWEPWVGLLMAGWFEVRWQQTGDKQFISLADRVWGQLRTKGKER